MNAKEQVLTTFQFEEPDREPCWLGASPEFRTLMQTHLGLEDDESLSVWVGDDFRRVFIHYIGPDSLNERIGAV